MFNFFAILQVGNWSRWFSNHLGLELDTLPSDDPETNNDDHQTTRAKTKCFCLLNELSELLMLPKDMLMDESIRKEVKSLVHLLHKTRHKHHLQFDLLELKYGFLFCASAGLSFD